MSEVFVLALWNRERELCSFLGRKEKNKVTPKELWYFVAESIVGKTRKGAQGHVTRGANPHSYSIVIALLPASITAPAQPPEHHHVSDVLAPPGENHAGCQLDKHYTDTQTEGLRPGETV